MTEARREQERMRAYLVGELDEETMTALEEQYFRDAASAVRLDVAADDLIDEYVSRQLSARDRTRVARLLTSPDWRRRFLLSKSLADNEVRNTYARTAERVPWLAWLAPTRIQSLGSTATTMVAVVVASGAAMLVAMAGPRAEIRLLRTALAHQQTVGRQIQAQVQAERSKRTALEETLSALHTVSFALVPGVSRGRGEDLIVPPDAQFVHFQLGLEASARRHDYRALLLTEGRQAIWSEALAEPKFGERGWFPELRIPAASLGPGEYYLSLEAADNQGRFSELTGYRFRIVTR